VTADPRLLRGLEQRLEDRLGRALDPLHGRNRGAARERLAVHRLADLLQEVGAREGGTHAAEANTRLYGPSN